MQEEVLNNYYMVIDEKSTGPFTLDEITLHPRLTPETLVWKPGIDNWVAAKTLPELSPAFSSKQQYQNPPDFNETGSYNQEPPYHSNPGHAYNNRYDDAPRNGYGNHQERYNYQNHSYGNQYHPHNPYNRNYNDYNRMSMRTNWLPWSIVATVLGFFTSCIGVIFGIIGIVQANKANNLYAQGFDKEGDAANSNAKIMTIIGLVFAGLGILTVLFFVMAGAY